MSFKLQEIFKFDRVHRAPEFLPFLSDSKFYWVGMDFKLKVYKFNTRNDEMLYPQYTEVKEPLGYVVSVGRDYIKALSNPLVTRGRIDIWTIYNSYDTSYGGINVPEDSWYSSHLHNYVRVNRDTRKVETVRIPYHVESMSFACPEGYEFFEGYWENGSLVSLWTKDGTYHILGSEGMKETQVREGAEAQEVSVFEGNLVHRVDDTILVNTEPIGTVDGRIIGMIENYVFTSTSIYRIIKRHDTKSSAKLY